MAVYVVTWHLHTERPNCDRVREEFIAHLNELDNRSDPCMDCVRFVSSTGTARDIKTFLRQKLDNNDRLLVSRVFSGHYAGWFEKGIWGWIEARNG